MGEMSSCLMTDTFKKHFKNKQLDTSMGVQAQAAGKVDLGIIGTATFQICFKGINLDHKFIVCQGINDDIMLITLAKQLALSYDAMFVLHHSY